MVVFHGISTAVTMPMMTSFVHILGAFEYDPLRAFASEETSSSFQPLLCLVYRSHYTPLNDHGTANIRQTSATGEGSWFHVDRLLIMMYGVGLLDQSNRDRHVLQLFASQ